ncbi:DUF3243 domain-containing protein [Schinkia azotoformans]|uniref:DUF3243 domain-containing protein n=2 Tax=Schinkia azotoformans TaxID=1454 RepID=K6CA83_SCHAZ|nr:DUF3243 domain-containing protein [Schinkia azotoformans]EKN68010.1 hypothetical protein BAZO_05819 [Schinkia azotoformans LMG 9581]MEC1638185.1 DUF3243 domain-containing protein [Schinkia azotoformans]MEC1697244.1 DUF3243 domain-containing protein [Schinkia azotoformans]MEC1715223.1 DUF3243 domain-containing protein [Schinkia azotoformans]MEC1721927.1 DUF3243 domain-containing protein [Schinkia azotoformans]
MSVLDNFEQWKDFLQDRMNQAKNNGMDQNTISDIAAEVGDYLAGEVQPKNPEQKLLAELWNVASEEEQQAIANIMVKLVQKS